jgi:crossover junction endodeoxyribonuclease RuvC
MYYIGFDLSLASTGVAVIDEEGFIVETLSIKTKPDDYRSPGGFSDRLVFITESLMSVLREYRPAKLAIEAMPFGGAGYGVQDRAQLLGVVRYRIATETPQYKDCLYVAPKSLKKKTTGSGNADKKAMKIAIDTLFNYDLGLGTSDEYDAVALCLVAGEWI